MNKTELAAKLQQYQTALDGFIERLREDQHMLVTFDEDRFQRGVDVGAVAYLDHLQRVQGVDHGARADRNAGCAQCAGEADDIVGHVAGWRIEVIDGGHGLAASSFRGAT